MPDMAESMQEASSGGGTASGSGVAGDPIMTGRRGSGLGLGIVFVVAMALTLVGAVVVRQFQPAVGSRAAAKVPLVTIGDAAPDFSLQDSQKEKRDPPIRLSSVFAKGPVVIIFHGGLTCPPCIQNLAEIARRYEEFKIAGIQVVAVGPDPVGADARDEILSFPPFPFLLLSDADRKAARAYGLESSEIGFHEGVFVVDKEGKIRMAKRADEAAGEVSELLNAGKAALNPG